MSANLNKLIRAKPSPREASDLMAEMRTMPDRAVAIMMGAPLEDRLEDLI